MPEAKIIKAAVGTVRNRSLPAGGFASYNGEAFRPDATAWAVIALEAYGNVRHLTNSACRRLARSQLADGRITVVEGHLESYWPTSLALIVWKKGK